MLSSVVVVADRGVGLGELETTSSGMRRLSTGYIVWSAL